MSTTELKLNGTTVLSENNSTTNLVTTTATIGSNALVVDSSGNVGIGTISPSNPSGTSLTIFDTSIPRINLKNSTTGDTSTVGGEIRQSGNQFLITNRQNSDLIFGTDNTEKMRIDSNGNVGIGTTTPSSKLVVVDGGATIDSSDASGYIRFTQQEGSAQIGLFRSGNSAGGGYIGGDSSFLLNVWTSGFVKKASIDTSGNMNLSGSLTQNSDIRLKENITDYTKGTTELMQIQVRQWQYNGKGETNIGQNGLGVIADEIENVLPSTVSTYPAKLNEDDEIDTDIKRFAASEITWLLVNTCKEQQALIESQQSQIDALIARIEALESN